MLFSKVVEKNYSYNCNNDNVVSNEVTSALKKYEDNSKIVVTQTAKNCFTHFLIVNRNPNPPNCQGVDGGRGPTKRVETS